MASKKSLQPYISLPLPKSLKDASKPQTKEERLRTILSNLEAHHNTVRNRLIAQAKAKHMALEEQREQEDLQPSTKSPTQEPQHPSIPSNQQSLDHLYQTLSTPYTPGTGDLSTSTTNPLPQPSPSLRQATPPPEIAIAKETLDQIELYEQHARPTREYYERALRRLREGRRESVGGAGGERPGGPVRTASAGSGRSNVASPGDGKGVGMGRR
ncbi:hypothetical protein M409DRAFT_58513 [Zasmidium cellare ATCC 36951]|uniref:Uncharacterized protein n=1 Tax=Zasmidium cellare ATCC 36951 TaxID=1080233 RepID=A0A6A6C4H6_ZASCE|nr:uncharacterized protein M409DRAFT_58513 [Zasmidium cellare ATCC 36951]KAF2162057.1 hypothetical protein M409DRAFT_58513 [Zasmidium cellare ATCC 36951]